MESVQAERLKEYFSDRLQVQRKKNETIVEAATVYLLRLKTLAWSYG